MLDTELLVPMAEIAGVFVGFGALIAVRSASAMDAGELTAIRWVMSCAMWVVLVGLAPMIISSYGLAGHDLRLVSSVVALVVWAVVIVVNARAPENQAELRATVAATPRSAIVLVYVPSIWLPTLALVAALASVVLGLLPDQEPALYLTAVGLGLLMSAIGLFVSVFWRRRPQAAEDSPPAAG